ncbi:MAG: hypothetical protein U0524_03905 [Candidatus Saccharimonadales bacterium]
MNETLTPKPLENQSSIGKKFMGIVAEHLVEGEISITEDKRYGLTLAIADFAVRGNGSKQIVRFKEYNQATNVTGLPGHETKHHRYAIESHQEDSDSKEWQIDYAIELDTLSGEFWQRIEDKNGISHHRLEDTGFVEIIAAGIESVKNRNDLIPLPD